MKSFLKILIILFFSTGLITILQCCKKSSAPSVTTVSASDINPTSAVSGGTVTNNGGEDVTARGVCWGTDQNPTISSSKTIDGTGNGPFTSKITGLTASNTYHVRAYATNSEGTGYGNDVSFTTSPLPIAALTTTAISAITSTSAVSGGNITNDGGSTITARGVCWNTSSNPTIENNFTTDGTGAGSFTSNLTNLQPGTTYYVKAYATNGAGTAYANNEVPFTTLCVPPSTPVVGTITQPSCSITTGSVAFSGLPATGTWTISKTPGGTATTGTGTSTTLLSLAAGTYTFTVTDASGCVSAATGNVVINTQPASPSIPVVGTIIQPTCAVATGSVALSGLPATGTWTLTRTPGGATTPGTGTSTTISGLVAGTYTFTVTDALSCVSAATGNVVINTQTASPSAPVVGTITQPTCAVATGSVALSGLPATGTWTLTRTPGGTTTSGTGTSTTISGLAAGTYTLTVTNASGCISAASANVVINTQPASSAPMLGTITQPTCAVATGSVVLSGLPSAGTWTITRTPGGTTTSGTGTSTTMSGLAAGTYMFTVADASGCVSAASSNVVINTQPATPSAPVVGTTTQPTCAIATGSVALSGLPATGTWTLTRTPGGTTTSGTGTSTTLSGLAAGTYTFTVTNSGCVSSVSGNVVINSQPITPSAPVVGTITQSCSPITTGSVVLSGLPSTGTWTLTRTPGGTTYTGTGTSTTVTGLPAGTTYTFTVTNSSGCVSGPTGNVVINAIPIEPSALTNAATNLAATAATLNGSVNGNGTSTTVTFDYGTTTSYGSSVTATQSPVTGSSFVSAVAVGLLPNTQYHFRVKAVNCGGTKYGLDQIFTTLLPFSKNGLVAYYPFNGNANDESGNGNNGTLLSGAILTSDKNGNVNKACSVNPGYVLIADNNSLDLVDFTLSIWFKPEQVTSAFNCLIGKNYTIAYAIGFDSGGSGDCPAPVGTKRPMRVYAGNHVFYFSASNFTCGSNTWYHVAVTYDNSTGVVNLYLNGNLTQSGSIPSGSLGNSTDPLAIGQDGHYGDKFTGDVDEVCIYNRVLSQAEITQLYNYY